MGASRVSFTVPGEPRGKGVVRLSVRGKGKAIGFKDRKTEHTMAVVESFAWEAMQSAGLAPFQGPVKVHLTAYRARGMPKTKKGLAAVAEGSVRPVTRPDCSNYAKLVEDSLNGVCFVDDSQVVVLLVEKLFSATPRVEVVVEEWSKQPDPTPPRLARCMRDIVDVADAGRYDDLVTRNSNELE